MGISIIAAVHDPSKDVLPTRHLFSIRDNQPRGVKRGKSPVNRRGRVDFGQPSAAARCCGIAQYLLQPVQGCSGAGVEPQLCLPVGGRS